MKTKWNERREKNVERFEEIAAEKKMFRCINFFSLRPIWLACYRCGTSETHNHQEYVSMAWSSSPTTFIPVAHLHIFMDFTMERNKFIATVNCTPSSHTHLISIHTHKHAHVRPDVKCIDIFRYRLLFTVQFVRRLSQPLSAAISIIFYNFSTRTFSI